MRKARLQAPPRDSVLVRLALITVVLAVACASGDESQNDARPSVCVVGGGPGGLQAASALQELGVDYVLFEKQQRVGAFFEVYPRHSILQTANKKYTARGDPLANLRADRLSLVSLDGTPFPGLSFTDQEDGYDVTGPQYAKYLRRFAASRQLNVRLSTRVLHVVPDKEGAAVLKLRDTTTGEDLPDVLCAHVLVATGLGVERRPELAAGEGHLTMYSEMEVAPDAYLNRTVAVIGDGPTAFEVMTNVSQYSRVAWMITKHSVSPSTSYFTKSVDLPSARQAIWLDQYQLKIADVWVTAPTKGARLVRHYEHLRFRKGAHRSGMSQVAHVDFDKVIVAVGWRFDATLLPSVVAFLNKLSETARPPQPPAVDTDIGADDDNGETSPINEERAAAKLLLQRLTAVMHQKRYPPTLSSFQVAGFGRALVVGELMHARDFRSGYGGTVGGFRHLTVGAVQTLAAQSLGVPLASAAVDPHNLVAVITSRLDRAPDIFLMATHMVDVYQVHRHDDGVSVNATHGLLLDTAKRVVAGECVHPGCLMIVVTFTRNFGISGCAQIDARVSHPNGDHHCHRDLHPMLVAVRNGTAVGEPLHLAPSPFHAYAGHPTEQSRMEAWIAPLIEPTTPWPHLAETSLSHKQQRRHADWFFADWTGCQDLTEKDNKFLQARTSPVPQRHAPEGQVSANVVFRMDENGLFSVATN